MKIAIVLLLLSTMFFGGYFIKDITSPKVTPPIVPTVTIKISPTDVIIPSNTPIPIPINTSITKPQQPTERALKAAGWSYVVNKTEEAKNKIRETAGITKRDQNTEIIQLALWLDNNAGYLAKVEAAMNLQQLEVQNKSKSMNCTTQIIGSFTYTTCD